MDFIKCVVERGCGHWFTTFTWHQALMRIFSSHLNDIKICFLYTSYVSCDKILITSIFRKKPGHIKLIRTVCIFWFVLILRGRGLCLSFFLRTFELWSVLLVGSSAFFFPFAYLTSLQYSGSLTACVFKSSTFKSWDTQCSVLLVKLVM